MLKSFFVFIAFASATLTAYAQEPTIQNQNATTSISTEFTNTDLEELMATADMSMIETLYNQGFDFNKKDDNGNPPLYYILARNPDLDIAKKVIEFGANVNQPAKNGMIPLNIATSKANELQLQIMMMKTMGLDTNNPKIQEELKKTLFTEMTKAIEMVKLLIESGADVNLSGTLGTPLMNAVTNVWNLDIVKMLIDAGADLNTTDKNGKTALFYAYASGNDDAVNLMIEKGADTSIKDIEGKIYSDMKKVNVAPAI